MYQTEILEMKNTVTEMKKSVEGCDNRLYGRKDQ